MIWKRALCENNNQFLQTFFFLLLLLLFLRASAQRASILVQERSKQLTLFFTSSQGQGVAERSGLQQTTQRRLGFGTFFSFFFFFFFLGEEILFTLHHILQGLVKLLQEGRDLEIGGDIEEQVVLVHAVANTVALLGNRPKPSQHDGR